MKSGIIVNSIHFMIGFFITKTPRLNKKKRLTGQAKVKKHEIFIRFSWYFRYFVLS